MNRRAFLRPAARRDLIEHYRFLASDSRRIAERFLTSARTTLESLAATPTIGRRWTSQDRALKGVRIWHVKGFSKLLVFYRSVPEGIEVLRVLHGARDLPNILEDASDDN
jgi:toxin ParE1/3/4